MSANSLEINKTLLDNVSIADLCNLIHLNNIEEINKYIESLDKSLDIEKVFTFVAEQFDLKQNKHLSGFYYSKALEKNPNNPNLILSYASVISFIKEYEDYSINLLFNLIRQHPQLIRANQTLGNIFYRKQEFFRSYLYYVEEYKLLRTSNKMDIQLLSSLACLAILLGYADEACQFINEAIRLSPEANEDFYNCLLYCAAHSFNYADSDISEIARKLYQECFKKKLSQEREYIENLVKSNNYEKSNRIKIGFLSSAFHVNSAEVFLSEFLGSISKDANFDFYCYYQGSYRDKVTEKFMEASKKFKFFNKNEKEINIAKEIANDGIHILVDTLGHVRGNCLKTFSLKPAPIQVSMLGYWGTTGLPQMDYFITSEGWLNDKDKKSYTENVLELPVYYHKSKFENININPVPFNKNGFITFGCMNRRHKVNSKVLNIWAIILDLVPKSKLLLSFNVKHEEIYINQLKSFFEEKGISSDRLIFFDTPSTEEFLKLFNEIDIALDPFPFSGGCTSADAIYMGTPIITQKGFKSVGRFTQRLLTLCHVEELIANDEQSYIMKAVELANNPSKIQSYKDTLRQKIIKAKILDPEYSAKAYKNCFLEIVKKHFQFEGK